MTQIGLFLTNALLGALPVLVFLASLEHFDSFKLVRFRTILQTVAAGAVAAGLAWLINTLMVDRLAVPFFYFTHLASPVVEEGLKALIVVALIRTNRIGFLFDAIILGFAIGTGFALVENFYFLKQFGADHPAIWMIRGFGTAIMHGGVAAIMMGTAHLLTLRDQRAKLIHLLPGFIVATAIHASFNHFLENPVPSTIVMMLLLAGGLAFATTRDRKTIHHWLEVDFDKHRKLLAALDAKRYDEFQLGRLLEALHLRFDDGVTADVIAYIRLHTELVLKAESVLLAHERGERTTIDEATKADLHRLHEIEKKIGRSAILVLDRHLHFSRHELWELYMLEKEAGFAHPHAHGA